MAEPTFEQKIINTLTAEDKVIVVSIVITLLLSPVLAILWFLDEPIIVPPPIISIFLGIAVSSLLYRFLGGVQNATLTVGAFKVAGAAAVLIFVAMWSNEQLKEFVPRPGKENIPFDISKHVIPEKDSWFAVDRLTGTPVSLAFPNSNQMHSPPSRQEINALRKERSIELKEVSGEITAYINNGAESVLGHIQPSEMNDVGYFRDYSVEFFPYRVEEFSSSQREDVSAELPFLVETKGFSENYTRFSLVSKTSGKEIYDGAILLRGAEVVKVEGRYYLISVVQVNHNPETTEPYAKIYVAEIRVNHV